MDPKAGLDPVAKERSQPRTEHRFFSPCPNHCNYWSAPDVKMILNLVLLWRRYDWLRI